jgi:hypothetical protein
MNIFCRSFETKYVLQTTFQFITVMKLSISSIVQCWIKYQFSFELFDVEQMIWKGLLTFCYSGPTIFITKSMYKMCISIYLTFTCIHDTIFKTVLTGVSGAVHTWHSQLCCWAEASSMPSASPPTAPSLTRSGSDGDSGGCSLPSPSTRYSCMTSTLWLKRRKKIISVKC